MEIGSLLVPRTAGFADRVRGIWQSRRDLQDAYPDIDSPALVRWAAVSGVLEYPEQLAEFYPPLPPYELRRTACGGVTEHDHLWTSTEDLDGLVRLWDVFGGRPIASVSSVFDFGCGCGRVLRWFPLVVPEARLFGCDVRKQSVDWCAANLKGVFFTNETEPPLDLPDDSIDFVYALSVFTHLSRASCRAWIRELARVCRPGGRILLTACGAFTLWVLCRSAEHQKSFQIDAPEARDYLARLHEDEFVYHRLSAATVDGLDGVEADYGQTFLTEAFVAREWAPFVRIAGYVPSSLALLQDFYVLEAVGGDAA